MSTPMWAFADALEFVRDLEPVVSAFGYHSSMGGGVLHKGQSDKDLDIVLIPANPKTSVSRPVLLERLRSVLSSERDEHRDHSASTGDTKYVHAFWLPCGARVDFFIF